MTFLTDKITLVLMIKVLHPGPNNFISITKIKKSAKCRLFLQAFLLILTQEKPIPYHLNILL